MTNKEAKLNLEKLLLLYDNGMIDFSVIRESVKVAISALEKQVPKKPEYEEEDRFVKNHFAWYAYCPQCGCEIDTGNMHCTQCGQAIDWTEE